jgi:hypothetical protein
MVTIAAQGLLGALLRKQFKQERPENVEDLLADGSVRFIDAPRSRPVRQVWDVALKGRLLW